MPTRTKSEILNRKVMLAYIILAIKDLKENNEILTISVRFYTFRLMNKTLRFHTQCIDLLQHLRLSGIIIF